MITVNTRHGVRKVEAKGTVLQSLEAAKVSHTYHCRSGFCGVCRCSVKKGSVRYVAEPLGYIRPGQILPCVCVAEGDLEIEVS